MPRLYAPARSAVPLHVAARPGDVRDSRADVSLITAALGYRPGADLAPALARTVRWHAAQRPHARATQA